MSYSGEQDSSGRVWVEAPYQCVPNHSSAVLGVWVSQDEEVQWTWIECNGVRYVNGYSITPKDWSEKMQRSLYEHYGKKSK